MLIVEGTDNVGKTTLCHKLVKALEEHGPWIYSHFTRLPKTWVYPDSYVPHIHRHVVRDRFHMSEITYLPCRGEVVQQLGHEEYRWLDGLCRVQGAFTVVILATTKFLLDHHESTGQMYNLDVHRCANRGFESIVNYMYAPYTPDFDYVIRINESWPEDRHVQNIITRYIERQTRTNLVPSGEC